MPFRCSAESCQGSLRSRTSGFRRSIDERGLKTGHAREIGDVDSIPLVLHQLEKRD